MEGGGGGGSTYPFRDPDAAPAVASACSCACMSGGSLGLVVALKARPYALVADISSRVNESSGEERSCRYRQSGLLQGPSRSHWWQYLLVP
jgi:hypothetical protein